MTNIQHLAHQIYDWLLLNTHINTKRIRELLWVVNITLIDTAIMVIQIWLQENEHINNVGAFAKYVS